MAVGKADEMERPYRNAPAIMIGHRAMSHKLITRTPPRKGTLDCGQNAPSQRTVEELLKTAMSKLLPTQPTMSTAKICAAEK